MKTLPFLLEIGAEEIPDWMIEGALEHLAGSFRRLLDEHDSDNDSRKAGDL